MYSQLKQKIDNSQKTDREKKSEKFKLLMSLQIDEIDLHNLPKYMNFIEELVPTNLKSMDSQIIDVTIQNTYNKLKEMRKKPNKEYADIPSYVFYDILLEIYPMTLMTTGGYYTSDHCNEMFDLHFSFEEVFY